MKLICGQETPGSKLNNSSILSVTWIFNIRDRLLDSQSNQYNEVGNGF